LVGARTLDGVLQVQRNSLPLTSGIGGILMQSVINRLKIYAEKNVKRGEKIFVTITLTNGEKFEGYINPDYDELSVEFVTNPGGDTIYIAVPHIVSILRRPRRVPTDAV
jgi:sRNA-binding regulator protein Hfq